jgi:hypothetical protein
MARAIAGLLMALLWLAGCSASGGISAYNNQMITLSDTSPSRLDVVLQLTPQNTYVYQFQVVVMFFVARKAPMDTHVQLNHNETMTCDGTKLSRGAIEFTGSFPSVTAGKTVTCTYRSRGAQAAIAYTIPPDLTLLTPHNGDKVQRSRDLMVTYSPAGAEFGTASVIAELVYDTGSSISPDSDPKKYSTSQPGTGTCQFDITGAHTGGSSLNIYREFDLNVPGSGFHSLTIAYVQKDGTGVDVV